jgi:hypothetical protein
MPMLLKFLFIIIFKSASLIINLLYTRFFHLDLNY